MPELFEYLLCELYNDILGMIMINLEWGINMNVRKETSKLVMTALMLSIAIIVQFLGKNIPEINQLFVGPLINAIILITVYYAGLKYGILIGALTPVMAFLVGQLAAPLAPFIPFISAGNIIYALVFGLLLQTFRGQVAGIVAGSFLKYIFLYFSATRLITLFAINIPPAVIARLAVAMGSIQFITALVGGAVALAAIRILKRRNVRAF